MQLDTVKSIVIKTYLTSRVSTLLLGAPGIGKSSIVFQAAELLAQLLNREFVIYNDDIAPAILAQPNKYFVVVDLRLTEVEPSDLIGIPRTDGNYVTYKPLLWARVMNAVPGIVFLDEITNVEDDTVLAASYKILLDRRVGYVPLNDGVMVIAAGNTPDVSSIARELPAPQVNRTMVLDVSAENSSSYVKTWLGYLEKRIVGEPLYSNDDIAYYRKIMDIVNAWKKRREPGTLYSVITAYLVLTKRMFSKPESAAIMQNFPTPRTWEMLYWTLTDEYLKIWSPEELRAVSIGFLGKDVGTDFANWLLNPLPNIEEIIENPAKLDELRFEDVILFAALLGIYIRTEIQEIDKERAKKIDAVIAKLAELGGRELSLVMLATLGTTKQAMLRLGIKAMGMFPSLRRILAEIGKTIVSG